MKFDLLVETEEHAFVLKVNEFLDKGWHRSGPAIIHFNGYTKYYAQAFEMHAGSRNNV
jgi:hypothetical protein